MNFAGSGLMMAIIVALWLLVFVPAWFQRNSTAAEERESMRSVSRSLKAEVRANLNRAKRNNLVVEEQRSTASRVRVSGRAHTIAAKIFRLRALRRGLSLVMVAGMLAAVASVAMLAVSQNYWFGVAGGCVTVAASVWAIRVVGDRLAMALESTVTMRGSAAVALNYAVRAMTADAGMVASANPRGWAPVELPAPKSNVGSIVATTMAEVVAFDVNQAAQVEGQVAAQAAAAGQEFDIDQILERRRRVG